MTDQIAISRTGPSPRLAHGRRLRAEHLAWFGVVLIAALMRLAALSATPLGATEGTHALGAWLAEQGRPPIGWAGSLTDALTALVFKLFGAGDAGARVVPALAGMALVCSFWLLRRHIGRGAALIAALLAALSPVLVADARNAGGQSLGMALAIVVAALLLNYLDDPRPDTLVALTVALAWGLGTDGIFIAGAGLALLWACICAARADGPARDAWLAGHTQLPRLVRALPIASAGLLLALSRYGLGFARLRPAALAEWSALFTPTRPDAPWHYALDVAAGYELPIALLGLAGAIWAVRSRRWRSDPALQLLLVWLIGGLLLALVAAARTPSTLLLLFVPCCLLGGVALDRAVRAIGDAPVEWPDLLVGAAVLMAIVYSVMRLGSVDLAVYFGQPPSKLLVILGPLLLLVFLAALYLRWEQAGEGALIPTGIVLLLTLLVWNAHGAASIAFLHGDEFITGERTTQEGAALARLLVANGGGVADVDGSLLPQLGWYLRDTLRSGGHGGAKLIVAEAEIPAGSYAASETTLIARGWSPNLPSGGGMVRWFLYREAWGGTRDSNAQLVVEGR